MTAEAILARVEDARKTAPDRWIARCPAHADRSPSLAIRSLSDGRTLIHCHALCDTRDVLDAIGLPMTVLFEERALQPGARLDRTLHDARDALRCLATEAAVLLDCSRQLRRGESLPDVDHARLVTACGRIVAAVDLTHG